MADTKSLALDLITLKQYTYLNKLRESVPKLKGSVPNFGLPKWKYLPLESKIPMIPGILENVYSFTRKKLGEPLITHITNLTKKNPLDTTDPYNREAKMPYEGMHDVHLAHYFRNSPNVRNAMIRMGLITPQMDVKCTLKEYNNYRNYLRVVHAKLIREELEKRDKLIREKKLLNVAENQTLKKIERLKKDEIRENLLKELKLKEEQKLKEISRKDKENDRKVENAIEIKRQMTQKKRIESNKKADYIKHVRAINAKKEEQKILNTLKKWHERDVLLRKTKEQNLMKKNTDKTLYSFNKLEQKKNLQEKQIERESSVKAYAEQIKNSFLQKYQRRLDENHRKLQKLFSAKKEALLKSLKLKKKKTSDKNAACHCKITRK